jgi:hypothetical protein
MTLVFIITGSLAFAGIAARFASRLSRKAQHPYPII